MIQHAIAKAAQGMDLSKPEMVASMEAIMEGEATPAQIGALLIALRMKGETMEEIAGAAQVMRDKALRVPRPDNGSKGMLLDIVGTGGDGAGTFNVSTTSAFVAAGAGVSVAKHGNRAVSSSCGSADLISALGIPLDLSPEEIGICLQEVGIGFLFAPMLHPAMANAIGPRREIGLRSIFNLLGPLTNPAGADALLVGVYDGNLTNPLAEALGELGVKAAMVVHGSGGYDEITVTGPTRASMYKDGRVIDMMINPKEAGLAQHPKEGILGGDPAQCRDHTLAVLSGEPGAKRDMVLINAGAALMVAGAAGDLAAGVAMAAESIDSGKAMAKLNALASLAGQLNPSRKGESRGAA